MEAHCEARDADLDMLEGLNSAYIDSVQHSNVHWFDQHLAADFMNSNPDGVLLDREAFLGQIAKPPGISSLAAGDVHIRVFGEFAIIHGRTTYAKADGSPGAGRYTDVWARCDGRWLCVAAHVTRG